MTIQDAALFLADAGMALAHAIAGVRLFIPRLWPRPYGKPEAIKGRIMKILLWIIAIIFIVGLLTITGVLKLIF